MPYSLCVAKLVDVQEAAGLMRRAFTIPPSRIVGILGNAIEKVDGSCLSTEYM